ncbi:hypothetical protein [Azospirillum brasilense]|nr:hypothetical protein [Azospirillum brasilense]UKJ73464.1 hypothetical protein H1Q64_02280 [Azospirillum brasilense]
MHVDAVLRLYMPDLEPESIAPKAELMWWKGHPPHQLSQLVNDSTFP